MIPGKSMFEFAAEIERQAKEARDFEVGTRNLNFINAIDPTGKNGVKLAVGSKLTSGIRDLAHGQIAEYLGIPKPYYERMRSGAPELLVENANHWMHSGDSEKRLLRMMDGNLRAFLSDKYRPINNLQIAEAVLPVLSKMPGLRVVSSEITERRMYIYATTDRISGEVKVGDRVQMGIRVSNSEVGFGMLSVTPTILVLRCTNGLTIDEGSSKTRHVGRRSGPMEDEALRELYSDDTKKADDAVLMKKIGDIVGRTMTETFFTKQLQAMQQAAGSQITGDVAKAVDGVVEVLNLTKAEGSSVLRNLIAGGEVTQWGMVNAVTALANDIVDYDRGAVLLESGGDLLRMPEKEWKRLATQAA